MKILSVVGARPQFVKSSIVSSAVRELHDEILVHTGQHYDYRMSGVFFGELGLPEPDYSLEVGSAPHGKQTGEMMSRLEEVVLQETPDVILVYGDTNSTLAGALVGSKMRIPVAHVEAGLRSHNRSMPEEINRIVTDHVSNLLFCPSPTSAEALSREGIVNGVHVVGDVMYDVLLRYTPSSKGEALLQTCGVKPREYILATLHRASNTDDPASLRAVLACLEATNLPVVLPIHPRALKALDSFGLSMPANVRLIEPVGYVDMLSLERNARAILTDSGGVQKEAFWLGVPCVTMRDETEWTETVDLGWNTLVGANPDKVKAALSRVLPGGVPPPVYGDGHAAPKIAALIASELGAQ